MSTANTPTLKEIYQPIESGLAGIDSEILKILDTPDIFSKQIIEYFFESRGKGLRPALCFFGAQLANDPKKIKESIPLAASLEILHGATLIHDDVIDKASLRRNRETINSKWGNKVSVLIGDYLYAKSLQAVFLLPKREVYALFLQTSVELCEGEILEIKEQNNLDLTQDLYLKILEKKTASLLGACLESGGMMAEQSEGVLLKLREYGRTLGMGFQIIDDCLDFEGTTEEFGKTVGIDCNGGVLTLPIIHVLGSMPQNERKRLKEILSATDDEGKFETVKQMVVQNGGVQYARSIAQEWMNKAEKALSDLPTSEVKDSLKQILDYVLSRRK